jgi:chemotaxis protein MotB
LKNEKEGDIVKVKLYLLAGIMAVTFLAILSCASGQQKDDREMLIKENANLKGELSDLKKSQKESAEINKANVDNLVDILNKEIRQNKIIVSQYDDALTINIVDEIFFNSGDVEVKKESHEMLNRIGEVLKKMPDKMIRVEGHTDDVPIAEKSKYKFPNNWSLGARRAVNVVTYFIEKVKIDPARLEVVSYSKYRPLFPNNSAENRAKNRRIEIVVLNKSTYQKLESRSE